MLTIWIKFASERVHHWPDAPQDYLHAHLANPHRHLMHVQVEVRVDEANRQMSFEGLRDNAIRVFDVVVPPTSPFSCEEMALRIGTGLLANDPGLNLMSVGVSEDGESGARWVNEGPLQKIIDDYNARSTPIA